jgi:hypothetical protein
MRSARIDAREVGDVRVLDRLQETFYRTTGRTELAEELRQERHTREFLQESIAELENRMLEPGWTRLTALADREFTREGLRQITAVVRVVALKNPLVKRGLALRNSYVWGQGIQITGRDENVNQVIQAFLDDPMNRRNFSGAQARQDLGQALGTDGNVFIACFTKPTTGQVQVRTLPWDDITDVVTNPDDKSEPWFYVRDWWSERVDPASGGIITERQVAAYPALGYKPAKKLNAIRTRSGETATVRWDAPVLHVKVGGLLHWKWGLGDAYAAVDWAQAYKDFLTDWATLVKSLSRFAWRLTSKGSRQAAARARLSAAPTRDPVSGEANFAGATASMPPDMALEAIPKSGATIDSDSGRPLAAMVAAALDVPVTMLLGDPGTTGARATAETLDTPTERAMELRREIWADAYQQILAYVIAESVRAPRGELKGTIVRDASGQEIISVAEDANTTVDISWPALDEVDVGVIVAAIVAADSTTYMPPLVTLRLLLEALGVTDVDEILSKVTDDQGNFVRPDGGGGGAGQAAVDAFRRGEDPAALFGNPDTTQQPAGQRTGSEQDVVPAAA